jgi:branched-chain amino acid transport system substrate-binding protein
VRSASAVLILLCVACTTGASPPPPAKTLHIAVDLPLTGPEGRAGTTVLNGVRFFVQTHPTLAGFTVELTAADDAGGGPANPSRGLTNLQGFLKNADVMAMIGPLDGAVARAEIPSANAAGLAMVTPATSNPCLTRDVYMPTLLNPSRTPITCAQAHLPSATELRPAHRNNFFRLATTDELQGAAAADYLYDQLHVLRAAVISDSELYGQGLAGAFAARFARRGGTVVGRAEVDPGHRDAGDFLNRMKQQGARAVYFGGAGEPGCAVRSQMSSVFPTGPATPFLGPDGIAHDPACLKAAGDNSAGIFATVPIADAASRTGSAATIRDFKARFTGTADFGPYTMPAYDATAILYAALERAITAAGGRLPARTAVISELARTSGFAGTTGTLGFDAAGDTTNRVVSIFQAPGPDPGAAWPLAATIDYSARLPY